jgi:hypothetical protein
MLSSCFVLGACRADGVPLGAYGKVMASLTDEFPTLYP